MTKKEKIDDILSQKTFAIAGMSRSGRKFGNNIATELKKKGFKIYPLHPEAEDILGEKCYKTFDLMPERPGALLINLPPKQTENVVRQAYESGINKIWIQQGSDSHEAIKFCEDNRINYVHGECIMMFLEPLGMVHGFHRFLWKVFGKYPK
jgi:uncharacterized protein